MGSDMDVVDEVFAVVSRLCSVSEEVVPEVRSLVTDRGLHVVLSALWVRSEILEQQETGIFSTFLFYF